MKSQFEKISYNQPYISGSEINYIQNSIKNNSFSGIGHFNKKCSSFFKEKFAFNHNYLTSSCTSALEMAALLCEFEQGDEVIIPSFCYMTTAAAFIKSGATVIFADSEKDSPNISIDSINGLITTKTKAIIIVHYAGSACKMAEIMSIVKKHNLILIEDCAHSIGAKWDNKFLGSFGHFSTFSFHETKNVYCGEGGLLVVNDERFIDKCDKTWMKGTNRKDFEAGKASAYQWVELGMSCQLSEINAAFLLAQLSNFDFIQKARLEKWNNYYRQLKNISDKFEIPQIETLSQHNGHIFYLKFNSNQSRELYRKALNDAGIMAIFHYQPLHLSDFWLGFNETQNLENAKNWADTILRLPLFIDLNTEKQDYIIETIKSISIY